MEAELEWNVKLLNINSITVSTGVIYGWKLEQVEGLRLTSKSQTYIIILLFLGLTKIWKLVRKKKIQKL